MATMDVEVVSGTSALAEVVADRVAEALRAAVAQRGRAAVAFSGGSTPREMLRTLAGRDLAWEQVTVWQVDERVAPDGHADRNATMLSEELLDRVPVTAHLMPVTDADLEAAARRYDGLLAQVCGGVLDVVHLGIGTDGHTASLVPGDPVLAVVDADVATTGPYEGRRRMTLTYPALNRARRVVWQVAEAAKAAAVAAMLEGGDVPAAGVARERAVLVVEAAAAPPPPA